MTIAATLAGKKVIIYSFALGLVNSVVIPEKAEVKLNILCGAILRYCYVFEVIAL